MHTNSGTKLSALWISLGAVLAIMIGVAVWWGTTHRKAGPRPNTSTPTSVPSRAHLEIAIEGMDCVMCAAGLQNELRAIVGVTKAEVSYQTKTATIEYDPKLIEPERFNELIKKDGFTIARQVSGRLGN